MKYYIVLLLMGILTISAAQKELDKAQIFSVEELREDFDALRKHIETNNPLAFVYHSKETIQRRLDSVQALINRPMTELAFYHIISPIAPMTKDGHNLIMPSVSLMKRINKSPYHIPLNIRFIENKLVIIRNLSSNNQLKAGDRITSINNVSTPEIIAHLLKVLPQEGSQVEYPKHIIDTWFGFFYNLHYGLVERYDIKYLNANQQEQQCIIQAESLETIYDRKVKKYPTSIQPKTGIEVKMLDDSLKIAILTIPTFATSFLKNRYNQKHFKKLINQSFDFIFEKDVQNLIIDVRSNSGGNPAYTAHTLKYLFDEPFTQAREARVITNSDEVDFMARTSKRWFPWYGVGTFKPKRQNYKNNLYVLMNGGTFSSAVEFVSTLSKYNQATFLGSESGGNPILLSGNYLKEMRKLPNTKITHYSGFIATIYNDLGLNEGRGLLPNHEVRLTIEDVLNGRDRCLEKTLELIQMETED
jgi:hypothetical protein